MPVSLLNFAQLTPRLHLCAYNNSVRRARRAETLPSHPGHTNFEHDFAGAKWSTGTRIAPVTHLPDALDFFLTATVLSGCAEQVAFGLELHCPSWSRENFFVMPGSVYDGNRFLSRKDAGYPPTAAHTGDVGPHAPIVIGDIPRLSTEANHSLLQQLSADLSTPAMGYFDVARGLGVWLLTTQGTCWGQTGFDLEEDHDQGSAILRLTAPGVREGTRYHCFQTDRPSPDQAPYWGESDRAAQLHARIHVFACPDRLSFLRRFTEIRQSLVKPVSPRSDCTLSSARDLIEEKFNRDNWDPTLGLYSTTTVRGAAGPDWQAGWVGGGQTDHALLVQGHELSRMRARSSMDFICTQAVAPSGFFRGIMIQGQWKDDSFGQARLPACWHMTRKSADMLLFLSKQIHWASPAPVAWVNAARGCADAFIRLWDREGQIGQFVDENTGELLVGGSEAASILPAALARLGHVLGEPRYLAAAIAIGDNYWARFARQGFTTGGPGEILSAPDSESAFGLLEAFVTLWEETQDTRWLPRAEAAADYCSTWCVSYHFNFPVTSTFASLQMATTGTVIASAQNKHSSPGICTLSGDSLFRLFRATGRHFYLNLIREIATSLPQYVSRADRPIVSRPNGKTNPPGWICERVNLSDWLEAVGEVFHGSCWCEVSLLLTACELPSIYFQTDTGLLIALDLLEVRLIGKINDCWVLEVSNTTDFDAKVRILAEQSSDCSRPLPMDAIPALLPLLVPAHSTIRHQLG